MRTFEEYNPAAVALYFLAAAGIAMFSLHPVILLLSLCGALTYFFVRNGLSGGGHLYTFLLFAVMVCVNPLVSHNGVTVLFVLNNNPVTLESLLYGTAAAVMIVSVLYWFRSFSQIMTEDRLLYLFGAFSPKLALILSMAMRYIPLFIAQTKKISASQKALGLYKEDNIIDSIRGKIRIFSVLVTWVLENGIVTADSMTARGYGIGRRSRYSLFRFRMHDAVLLVSSAVLAVFTLVGTAGAEFVFYPAVSVSELTAANITGYTAYAVLCFIPTWIDVKEALRWRGLQSKI